MTASDEPSLGNPGEGHPVSAPIKHFPSVSPLVNIMGLVLPK